MVLLRSLPPFSLQSIAGAVKEGRRADDNPSGDYGNAGAAQTGASGLPGVLSTRACSSSGLGV
jgi:hypothetical protein